MPSSNRVLTTVIVLLFLSGCGGGGGGSSSDHSPAAVQASNPPLSAAGALGKKIFFDTSLSASGQQSCATCHVPDHAHAGADGLAVPLGGIAMNTQGFRNTPSLNYLSFTPAFF